MSFAPPAEVSASRTSRWQPAAAALAIVVSLTLLPTVGARADKSDRNQPLHFAADSASVDDQNRVNVLTGNVEITKGSIVIRANRVEVRQNPQGQQSAVATGWPDKRAYFRQKREGRDEYIEGEAQRLEYDGATDTVKLIGNAVMRRYRGSTLSDEVQGKIITYDNTTEVFQVLGGTGAASAPGGSGGRVHGVLTPRDTSASGASAPAGKASSP